MTLRIGAIPPLAIPAQSIPDYSEPMIDVDDIEVLRLRVLYNGLEIQSGRVINLGILAYPDQEFLPFNILNENDDTCSILRFQFDPTKLNLTSTTIANTTLAVQSETPLVYSTIQEIAPGDSIGYETIFEFDYQFSTQTFRQETFKVFIRYRVERAAERVPGPRPGAKLHPNSFIDRYDSLNRNDTDFDRGLPRLPG